MKISKDELIDLLDEFTAVIGQILATHCELSESVFNQTQSRASKEKIDQLKAKIDTEREKLATHKHVLDRKRELEKIRTDHAKASSAKAVENEVIHGRKTTQIFDGTGKLVGRIQPVGAGNFNIFDAGGRLVAREIGEKTYAKNGKFMGRGRLGLMVLGQTLRK